MGKQIMNGVTYGKPREILEVTQAQYDALSQAQKMNGTLYCIKDDGIVEGEKFAPVIYSTGEREIGTWIDGKPLYQKTIDMGTLSADTYKTVLYADVGIGNLEHVAYIDIIVNDTYNVCFNRPDNVNTEFYSQLTPTGIFLRAYNTAVTKAIATIQYTKTTDVPGSGEWTSTGVPAVHYSTDEQVIGTWIDGKPLYQKTIYGIPFTSNEHGAYPLNIDTENCWFDFTMSYIYGSWGHRQPWYSFDVYEANGILYFQTSHSSGSLCAVIKYTKSTD